MTRSLQNSPDLGRTSAQAFGQIGAVLALSAALTLLPGLSPTTGSARAQTATGQEELQYVVRGLGLKLGELWVASRSTNSRYRTISRFATTGALRTIAKVRFDLQSEGRWRNSRQQPEPRSYTEDINTGRRQSKANLSYVGGIPRVETSAADQTVETEQETPPPVNPLTQRGTIDPATALLLAAGPHPEGRLCDLDQAVFDGARRTRLVLSPPLATEAGFTCRGALIREAGYTEKQLRKDGSFDLSLNYVRRRDGQYILIGGRVETVYGPITLEWRTLDNEG